MKTKKLFSLKVPYKNFLLMQPIKLLIDCKILVKGCLFDPMPKIIKIKKNRGRQRLIKSSTTRYFLKGFILHRNLQWKTIKVLSC